MVNDLSLMTCQSFMPSAVLYVGLLQK